jgi:tetratricopeptide (TPR) repeat protein
VSGENFGTELRRLRQAAGHTLRTFAPLVHLTYAHLSKVETGDRRPTQDLARLADQVLNAGGSLVALAAQERAVRVRTEDEGKGVEEVHRRSLLNAAASLAVGVAGLAGIDIDPTTRRRLDMNDVTRIRAAVDRLWTADHGGGGADLWDLAVSRAHSVSLLLDLHDYNEQTGQALLTVAGQAYMAAGWLATDAERHDVARSCYNEALNLGEQATNAAITTHALANLALRSLLLSRPQEALRYVDAAGRALPSDAPVRQAALLHMRRARALAQMGEATEAGQELTVSRRMLDRESSPPPERLAFFTPAEVDANAAACASDLGQTQRAPTLLTQAINDYAPRFTRNRALYLVRLAGARTATGAPDGAAEATDEALDILGSVASPRVRTELATVTGQLNTYRHIPAVDAVLCRAEPTIHPPTGTSKES